MQYKSSVLQDSSQSWYFVDLQDSRLNMIPPNTITTVDTSNANRIITGGGALSDNGNNLVTTFEILTTSGYDETKIVTDHNKAKAQKFMMLPTDWINFEITCYLDFINTNPDSEVEFFGRSGRHVNGRPCEGTKYDLTVTADGYLVGHSKHFHSGGSQFLRDNAVFGDLEGRKVGVKFIVYNNSYEANPTAAIIEGFVDRFNDNKWEKVYDYTDTGLDIKYIKCGDSSTGIISWGGPIVGLRIIDFPEGGLAIDKLSVRSINAISPKIILAALPAIIDPEAVSPPTSPPSTGYRIDLTDLQDDDIYAMPPWGEPGDNTPP